MVFCFSHRGFQTGAAFAVYVMFAGSVLNAYVPLTISKQIKTAPGISGDSISVKQNKYQMPIASSSAATSSTCCSQSLQFLPPRLPRFAQPFVRAPMAMFFMTFSLPIASAFMTVHLGPSPLKPPGTSWTWFCCIYFHNTARFRVCDTCGER